MKQLLCARVKKIYSIRAEFLIRNHTFNGQNYLFIKFCLFFWLIYQTMCPHFFQVYMRRTHACGMHAMNCKCDAQCKSKCAGKRGPKWWTYISWARRYRWCLIVNNNQFRLWVVFKGKNKNKNFKLYSHHMHTYKCFYWCAV